MAKSNQKKSWLTPENLRSLEKQIQETYLNDNLPWIVGYSGGKDSTTTLQIVWIAVSKLQKEKRQKPIYVISSDTLVETPVIVNYIDANLKKINDASKKLGLPFQAHKVAPEVLDSFWVNLIGKGYPAPSKAFRWCTSRLKISPANKFIVDKAAEFGEVIVVLGSRIQESATRAQVINFHKQEAKKIHAETILAKHSTLPNAWCYTPIENFSTQDVWNYLLQVPSPWGNNNHDLITLYKNAQAGECPLVVDKNTSSCGNSRFGCWVCTVVEKDHSMEALVDGNERWMAPLLDFRNWLASTQDPAKKQQFRDFKSRTGQFRKSREKEGEAPTIAPGPYHFKTNKKKAFDGHVRQEIFRQLLITQKQIMSSRPNHAMELISLEEIKQIRNIWLEEESDWQDSASRIYQEVMNKPLDVEKDDLVSFSSEDRELLETVATQIGAPAELLAKLLDAERQHHGMSRRSSIYTTFDKIFAEEWRTEEEFLKELTADVN